MIAKSYAHCAVCIVMSSNGIFTTFALSYIAMHTAHQPKIVARLSPRLSWVSLGLLGMYLCVLGLLFVHTLGDEHHQAEPTRCCQLSSEPTELHYHATADECSLPAHNLPPSTLAYTLRLDKPRGIYLNTLYHEPRAEEVFRSICYYLLRAPPRA